MNRRDLLLLLALAAAAPAAAHAEKAGDKKKKSGGDSYLPIDTLTGATPHSDGRRGVLAVECGLDVPDAGLRARADALLPRLRAAYLQIVIAYAAGLRPGWPPNPDYIGMVLQRQTDQMLGRPGARVLLGAILVN
jgi:hypothetical protein